MKKKWLLKGGLIALFSPLLSSACFVQNSDKPTDPANRVPVDGGTPSGGGNNGQPGNSTQHGNGDQSGGGARPGENSQARFVHSWDEIFNDSPTGADIFWHPSKDELEKEEKRLDDEVKKILDENKKINEKIFNEFIKSRIDSIFRDSPTGMDITLHPTKEELEKEEKRLADEVKKILDENKKINEKVFKEFVANGWYAIFRDDATGSEIGKVSLYDYETMSDKALNKLKAHFMKVKEFYDNIVSSSDKASESLRKQYEAYISNLKNELETNKKAIEKKIAETKSKLNYLEKEKLVKAKAELAETKESKKDILDLLEGAKEEKAYYESEAKIANEEVAKIKVFGDKIDDLEKQIKESEAKIESLSSQIKQKYGFYELILNVGRRITDLKKQNKYLETLIKDKQSDNFADSFVFNNDYKFNHELIKEWKPVIENNKEEIKEIEEEIGRFTSEYENVINEVDKLIQEQASNNKEKSDLDKELAKLTKEVETITKGTKDWKSYLEQKEKEVAKAKENVVLYERDTKRLADLMKTGDSEESKGEKEVKESEADLVQLRKEQERLLKEQKALEEKERIIFVLEKNKDKNNDSFDKNVFKYEIQSDKVADEIEKIEKVLEKRKQERIKKILTGVSEITKELFNNEFPNLVKEAVERYKKHGDKHASESAKMTAELFQDLYRKAVEEVKARIYRDSKSGLDINAYLTKEQIDKIVKDYLAENWRNNKAKFDEYLAAKETEEIFGNGYAKAIEEVKARIFRDSKSGLDIDVHLTQAEINEIVKKFLEENKELNKRELSLKINSLKAKESEMLAGLRKIENDSNNSELRIKSEVETKIKEINNTFEMKKKKLEKLEKENDKNLNALIKNKDLNSEVNLASESLKELNELLTDAKALALENEELINAVNKDTKKGTELDIKIKELESELKRIDDLTKTDIEMIKREIKSHYENAIKEEIELLDTLYEENEFLYELIEELKSEKNPSDQWYYNNRERDGFNHQHIARLKDAMWSNDEEFDRVVKLTYELENYSNMMMVELDKIKEEIEIERAKKPTIESNISKARSEKAEVDKAILDRNKEFTKAKELLVLYNNDISNIEKNIKLAGEKYEKLLTQLKAHNEKMSEYTATKAKIEESNKELEESTRKALIEIESQFEKQILELDKNAYELEEKKYSELKELSKEIDLYEKAIKEIEAN
ncbi:hypothetical protein J8A71_03035 [Mycoplasmopsis agalactiae]|uniref:MAG6090-like repeat-containing lipoprotein n=1 Tax=Mycoplasmopsis agalactiae TaxID=2110 RepID=UPI001F248241|nr:hypothetical protein [Mycoplasmopsis agalactiae]MCE6061857.1 hypothetical protein [Mycoplasmopsis agalactiae]